MMAVHWILVVIVHRSESREEPLQKQKNNYLVISTSRQGNKKLKAIESKTQNQAHPTHSYANFEENVSS